MRGPGLSWPRFIFSDERAACRDVDPEVFFPAEGRDGHEAKAICRHCPLRGGCAEWALDQPGDLAGVWGELTARDRRRLKRGRR